MERAYERKLILEDGQEYCGYSFGSRAERVCEVVFNTSMAGYQEILSDPSYAGQAVVMSYPLIGNYGMAEDDYESAVPAIGALIVRDYNDEPSGFRSRETLESVMERFDIPGIGGVDTRKLVRSIRDKGSRRALIADAKLPLQEGLRILNSASLPGDQVSRVSCRKIYATHTKNECLHVAAIDCGMKRNILRMFHRKGCRVTIFPWNTPSEVILGTDPDGIFISNGPGDPTDVPETVKTVRELRGRCPIFGICLGHQILSLAYGARTYKLKFGHRGGNHPVRSLETGRIEITSQNHSYAVDEGSLKDTPLTVTHRNLLDQTVEGVRCDRDRAFSVQYHPESAPGPQDSGYLFDEFVGLMEEARRQAGLPGLS